MSRNEPADARQMAPRIGDDIALGAARVGHYVSGADATRCALTAGICPTGIASSTRSAPSTASAGPRRLVDHAEVERGGEVGRVRPTPARATARARFNASANERQSARRR
jgi:hypothetical protein